MREIFRNINHIIERDSKDTTYKFALLRATIDVIQEQSPWIRKNDSDAEIPLGLLVLKWLEYYYPIIEHRLPQKNGDNFGSNTLSFRKQYVEIIGNYASNGGFELFYGDVLKGEFSPEIRDDVYYLCKKIRDTIKDQPMRYLGKSVFEDEYKLYRWKASEKKLSKPDAISAGFMIERFGSCLIPLSYYEVFEYMGSFITGKQSILTHWAEFTVEKSDRKLTLPGVLPAIMWSNDVGRNVRLAKDVFSKYAQEEGRLYCVWSGKKISRNLNIDHVMPYSVYRNNDLWNLLPAGNVVNNQKRDRIPSPLLLNQQKDMILDYWSFMKSVEPKVFNREMLINLVSKNEFSEKMWGEQAISALIQKSEYLIHQRGYEAYEGP